METDFAQNISIGFSSVYAEYEALSRNSFIDIDRRNVIRKQVELYLKPDHKILEINAGSGIDAVYFAQKGNEVLATDISDGAQIHIEKKIKQSGLKNLRFRKCAFTSLSTLGNEKFDHVFSNFGGLNCSNDLSKIFVQFDSILNPNGFVTLVVMPKIYPWEMVGILKGSKNAFRRFSKNGVLANVGDGEVMTFYHSPKEVKATIGKNFTHLKTRNIGTFYPSAHFKSTAKYPSIISKLMRFDYWMNGFRLMPKGIGDYFTITFQKTN